MYSLLLYIPLPPIHTQTHDVTRLHPLLFRPSKRKPSLSCQFPYPIRLSQVKSDAWMKSTPVPYYLDVEGRKRAELARPVDPLSRSFFLSIFFCFFIFPHLFIYFSILVCLFSFSSSSSSFLSLFVHRLVGSVWLLLIPSHLYAPSVGGTLSTTRDVHRPSTSESVYSALRLHIKCRFSKLILLFTF